MTNKISTITRVSGYLNEYGIFVENGKGNILGYGTSDNKAFASFNEACNHQRDFLHSKLSHELKLALPHFSEFQIMEIVRAMRFGQFSDQIQHIITQLKELD